MDTSLKGRWDTLDGRKKDMHTRNEKYARWTLPYLYPLLDQSGVELDTDLDSIGARATNHLSNKIVETIFPAYRSFLKLEFADEVKQEFVDAKVPMATLDKTLVGEEKRVLRTLSKMGHRTAATLATKYLIVTGNALMYYPEGKTQVYNTRDYCLVRDLSGEVIEIMTRDTKAFETFSKTVQDEIRTKRKDMKDDKEVTNIHLYTQIKLDDNGKYHVKQAADMVELDVTGTNTYSKKDLPWIPLSWNLVRGEDYARGMVEDYRGAFNALDVLSQALIEGVIGAAALKFLVNPASVVDVEVLNKAANGSYHTGRDGDIVAVKSDKHLDFQQVRLVIEDYSRQLAQAFLLGSEVTRDAERVTAEEIRADARELEMSFGGIYSRFTEDWQEPVAGLILSRRNIIVNEQTIFPTIVTGLDTLSRLGDLDNFRMFMNDLAIIAAVPEAVQARLKVGELMTWVGNNRGVDYTTFLKTEEEIQAEQQQALAQQQALQQQQASQEVAVDAGKELAKQE